METSRFIYLISFNANTNKYIIDIDGMGDIIKARNKYGINSIKLFDSVSDKFVRLSKDNLKAQASYYTHTYQELLKSNYIKD